MRPVVGLLLCLLPVAGVCLDRQLLIADFNKADSIAALYHDHPLTDLTLLAKKLTLPLSSDAEKFRSIYRWVCSNVTYDRGTYLRNKRMRSKLEGEELVAWNSKVRLEMFRELGRHRKTVCTGYAWLVTELATRAGLTCIVVDGYGRNVSSNIGGPGVPNHSWNAVRLDGCWFLCDATWSAGAFDASSGEFIPNFNITYFLTDPELFIRNHYPLNPKWSLLEHPPSLQQFLHAPLVYTASLRYGLRPHGPENFEVNVPRGDTLKITFTLQNVSRDRVTLYIGSAVTDDVPSVKKEVERSAELTFKHHFRGRGVFAVNVMVNAEWVLSYRVRVE